MPWITINCVLFQKHYAFDAEPDTIIVKAFKNGFSMKFGYFAPGDYRYAGFTIVRIAMKPSCTEYEGAVYNYQKPDPNICSHVYC